jgi:uncharacterized protein (TIGR02147 family)
MANKNKDKEIKVFNYDSALSYIQARIEEKGHGYKAIVAKAVNCQSAYVSRVLSGQAYFSLEQAERLSDLFNHSETEAHYFLSLLQRDRAGTPELHKYFDKIIDGLKAARSNIKNRVPTASEISDEERHKYYSSWMFGAVYVMTSIPEYQSPLAIAERLSVPRKKVLEILEFLVSIGLVKEEQGRYLITGSNLHLAKDSPYITKHHLNWRIKALSSVEINNPEDLHYSVVMSVSKKDQAIIKAKLIDLIGEMHLILPDSKEEGAQVLCLDLFDL